jgi:hypothetical protein
MKQMTIGKFELNVNKNPLEPKLKGIGKTQ